MKDQIAKNRIQKKLRNEDDKIVSQLSKIENFTGEAKTNREALRKARIRGNLWYKWSASDIEEPEPKTTKLDTETRDSHVKAMMQRAKKFLEAEEGAGAGEAEMGGMPPLLESKIKKTDLEKIILEEISNLLDIKLQERKRKPGRMRVRKNVWPYNEYPRYWQGKAGEEKSRKAHKASFSAFYADVLKNKEAMKSIGCSRYQIKRGLFCKRERGGMDYMFGDQHADAYAVLMKRQQGKVQVSDKEAEEIKQGIKPVSDDTTKGGGETEKTELIRKLENVTKRIEVIKRPDSEMNKNIAELEGIRKAYRMASDNPIPIPADVQKAINSRAKRAKEDKRRMQNLRAMQKEYADQLRTMDARRAGEAEKAAAQKQADIDRASPERKAAIICKDKGLNSQECKDAQAETQAGKKIIAQRKRVEFLKNRISDYESILDTLKPYPDRWAKAKMAIKKAEEEIKRLNRLGVVVKDFSSVAQA